MRRADEVKRRGPSSFARPRQIALAIGQIGHVSKQLKKTACNILEIHVSKVDAAKPKQIAIGVN